ncbi:phosphohistidine phosphatase SixA [Halomonas sp. TRM85114]|uniref:phosphohistidine phosphatase SixA n=1 Tax=Halomonas jincaotanensis TaxID=2810616 RepID=UPI001BD253E9|nr:phosphohistidine phosphatase SixA [Halomonas jincaotanensis]MBS9404358.1 phosphohistidine phosphatase SixA [Halomonas jincaotanensis]
MTERLLIMRHGQAAPGQPDTARELTREGCQEVRHIAAWLSGRDDLDLARLRLVASPYARAHQTAELVAEGLAIARPQRDIETLEIITPDDPPDTVLDWLLEQGDERPVLIVSHMPLVGALTGLLVDGRADGGPTFPTGAIAELTTDIPAAGCARLARFTAPADIAD